VTPSLPRRLVAEGVGTALLLAAVVGSGIMAERICGGNAGLALLANAGATGATLVGLILALGSLSAHFNPAVTLVDAALGGRPWREVPAYVLVQVLAALAGVALAHFMFELPVVQSSTHARTGTAQAASDVAATFGLLLTVWGCQRSEPRAVPFAVGAYIAGAYWWTASTSFANPAVTIARAATDTFAGIRPGDVPPFVAAQLVATLGAIGLFRWWWGHEAG
jgi:glycerol uptake facilitator-like aquaporin